MDDSPGPDRIDFDDHEKTSQLPMPDVDADEEQEITAFHDFIAGGLAGSASVVVGHPFDTIKVRLQTAVPGSGSSSGSLVSSFGGVASLFRGMGAPLASAAAVNAIIFSSYGLSSRFYDEYIIKRPTKTDNDYDDDNDNDDTDDWKKSFLCGSFAGLVQCVVICPMEHVKCRLQVQHGKGAADNIYSGPMQATRSILQSHGLAGLYRGWWCTTLREVPAFGLYFSTYDYIKDSINAQLAKRSGGANEDAAVPMQRSHVWLASMVAGGISGCLTWAAVYPVDVIKTRIQTASLDKPVSFWNVGRHIVATQGWQTMFRGLGITLVRAFPVNGTIFPVYEFTLTKIASFERGDNDE